MNDTLWYVAATAILLIVTHNGLAYPPVRRMLVARFEEWPLRMLYAMIAVAALTLLVLAYLEAPEVQLWQPPTALQWAGFALCGALGSAAHFALTRSFTVAAISSWMANTPAFGRSASGRNLPSASAYSKALVSSASKPHWR